MIVYLVVYASLFSIRFILGTDYPLAVVEGNSMIPNYLDGDIVLLRGTPPEGIPIGTVIVFHNPYNWENYIIHRIMKRLELDGKLYFVTKGDNNLIPDTWRVPAQNIVGVVIYRIEGLSPLGHFIIAWQSPIGRILSGALIVALLAFDIYQERKAKTPS